MPRGGIEGRFLRVEPEALAHGLRYPPADDAPCILVDGEATCSSRAGSHIGESETPTRSAAPAPGTTIA